jgi:transposase-like protein
VASLDVTARHFTEEGRPLLTAAELAEVYGIKPRTVYQWRRRGFLRCRGLDEDGQELYDAGEVADVQAKPRRRQQIEAIAA